MNHTEIDDRILHIEISEDAVGTWNDKNQYKPV